MIDPPDLPPFTYVQLRYFLTVAAQGHIGRAAERLNISQPPLSRQIQALDHALGHRLFQRTAHGVSLTAAGQAFQEQAVTLLRAAGRTAEHVDAAARGLRGRLRLGFTMYAAYGALPALVRRVSEAAPDLELSLSEVLPDAIATQLHDGRLDAAITFPGGGGDGSQSRLLARDPLVAALPRQHPLAQGPTPSLAAYADLPFLICPRHQAPLLFDSITRYCQSAGFTPQVRLQAYLQQTLINLVAEGLGIAFVPASVSRAQLEGVVYRPLPDPPSIDQVLVWKSASPSPSLAVLLAQVPPLAAPYPPPAAHSLTEC
jgi:DNA-binding transcriptional LysR family regulator